MIKIPIITSPHLTQLCNSATEQSEIALHNDEIGDYAKSWHMHNCIVSSTMSLDATMPVINL